MNVDGTPGKQVFDEFSLPISTCKPKIRLVGRLSISSSFLDEWLTHWKSVWLVKLSSFFWVNVTYMLDEVDCQQSIVPHGWTSFLLSFNVTMSLPLMNRIGDTHGLQRSSQSEPFSLEVSHSRSEGIWWGSFKRRRPKSQKGSNESILTLWNAAVRFFSWEPPFFGSPYPVLSDSILSQLTVLWDDSFSKIRLVI